jgi:hypothetical protein
MAAEVALTAGGMPGRRAHGRRSRPSAARCANRAQRNAALELPQPVRSIRGGAG